MAVHLLVIQPQANRLPVKIEKLVELLPLRLPLLLLLFTRLIQLLFLLLLLLPCLTLLELAKESLFPYHLVKVCHLLLLRLALGVP